MASHSTKKAALGRQHRQNRLIRVAPDGARQVGLEEVEREHLDWFEAAYLACQ